MIDSTSTTFFNQLYLKYKKELVVPQVDVDTLINSLNSMYMLKQIDADDIFDKISRYSYFIDNKKEECSFFLLEENKRTEIFYDYYKAKFSTTYPICLVINRTNYEIMSTCDLFEMKVNILKGINSEDLKNNTNLFKNYLNFFYLYEIALGNNVF